MKKIINLFTGIILASICLVSFVVILSIVLGKADAIVMFFDKGESGVLFNILQLFLIPWIVFFGFEYNYDTAASLISVSTITILVMTVLCFLVYSMYKKNKISNLVYIGFISNYILSAIGLVVMVFLVLSFHGF